MENETTQTEKITSRSVGIRFGLYNAIIGLLMFAVAVAINDNPFSDLWNWSGMAIGIALIVIAHIQYKNNGDGFMAYGEGVGIGFWIGLISTVITVPLMYGYLSFVDNSPFELFLQQQEEKMIAGGAPDEAVEMGMKWTKNLFWPIACIMGIIGSVVTALIVSIFTKKSRPEMPV